MDRKQVPMPKEGELWVRIGRRGKNAKLITKIDRHNGQPVVRYTQQRSGQSHRVKYMTFDEWSLWVSQGAVENSTLNRNEVPGEKPLAI